MVWPQEEKTGKADESNLQKLLQKREGTISSPHARWRRGGLNFSAEVQTEFC